MTERARILLVVLLAACASPSTTPRIVLQVDSDLTVPSELDRITVEVEGQTLPGAAEADLHEKGLPRSLTLLHDSGPLGPVRVTVHGWLGATELLQRKLDVWFQADAEERIFVSLDRSCLSVMCEAAATCQLGSCIAVPTIQPAHTVTTQGDAGKPSELDGGTDAARQTEPPSADAAAGSVPPDSQDASQKSDASPVTPVGTSDAGVADGGPSTTATPDAATPPPPPPPPTPGQKPVCSIALPVQNDFVSVNTQVAFRGSCTDPETGPVSAGLTWTSQVDGQLATGASSSGKFLTAGRQRLTLCAPDPRDARVTGCTSIDVSVTAIAQPSAEIISIMQSGGASGLMFFNDAPIEFRGVGTGAGVTLSWSDNPQGALGTGTMAALAMPMLGMHTVTLTVRDRDGKTAIRSVSFVVRIRPRNGP